MKTTATVNECLNRVLRGELTIINQYFLHARLLSNFGFEALGKQIYRQSIAAMKSADALVARIFLLEGLPNLQDLGKLLIGEDAPEVLSCDLKVTQNLGEALRAAVAILEGEGDYVSRALVEHRLAEVEEYADWLETQQDLIRSLGLENYLQQAV